METLIAVGIGILAGLHSASWGMFKDAPHEGFAWRKYLRSPILSGLVALAAYPLSGLDITAPAGLALFFGLVYVTERAILEYYKTFLREEDQSKYYIPMQFHVGGEVVEDRRARLGVAAAYLVGVLGVVVGIEWLQRAGPDLPGWAAVVVLGSVGGWISAFGGAWKDGPIEGFQILKFFRSPLVALTWAVLLAHFTRDYLLVVLPATGYTVATIETYKTFFFPNEPRGKFAGMPVHFPKMLERRKLVVPLYAAIWLAVLATLVLAFLGPREGLLAIL